MKKLVAVFLICLLGMGVAAIAAEKLEIAVVPKSLDNPVFFATKAGAEAAAAELGVRSPLKEAGLTKDDIRAVSREMDLPTWNLPSMACLASRFPYGRQITREALERVAKAERILRELGYEGCRVRDHDTIARIEVPADRIGDLAARDRARLVKELKGLGYTYVALDLEGYRPGAMDEVL